MSDEKRPWWGVADPTQRDTNEADPHNYPTFAEFYEHATQGGGVWVVTRPDGVFRYESRIEDSAPEWRRVGREEWQVYNRGVPYRQVTFRKETT